MLRTLSVTLATLGLFLGWSPAWGEAGPFGLTWGMSRQEARSLPGIEILREDEGDFFSTLIATQVPKGLSETDSYGLLFSRQYGLVKVQWSGHPFLDDKEGAGARTRYAELKDALEQRYGRPSSREFSWPKAGWDPTGFYACLGEPICGPYESTWSSGPVTVRLEIQADTPDSGRVRLSYEHERLALALEEAERMRLDRERDSL